MNNTGIFTISLDFELYWGVKDHFTLEQYGENILGVRTAIPAMLEAFKKHKINATWATVGLLFFEERDVLLKNLPLKKPTYFVSNLSPYPAIEEIGRNEKEDPYHFGKNLISLINSYHGQEIATHTFSHYYCLEEGQTVDQFEEDILNAINTGRKSGFNIVSLVFPRNQFNASYLEICKGAGIKCYRGNENSWIYKARNQRGNFLYKRFFRFVDSYINISGHNTYKLDKIAQSFPYNIPSSRFLRPYSSKLHFIERLRLRRIKKDMLFAARNNNLYHLWWHPHNFGKNLQQNMNFLNSILDYYSELKAKYNMQSLNMKEITDKLDLSGR